MCYLLKEAEAVRGVARAIRNQLSESSKVEYWKEVV
jgi:hypothetical protein